MAVNSKDTPMEWKPFAVAVLAVIVGIAAYDVVSTVVSMPSNSA